MDRCPKCREMTAERNHYTKKLICYNRKCLWKETDINEICATCIMKCKKDSSVFLACCPSYEIYRR